MQKKELLNLYEAIKIVGDLRGMKFVYAMAKNVNLIKDEIDSILKAVNTDEKKEFEDKRIELAKKYSKKDKDNKPIMINNSYIIGEEEKFNKEFSSLKKEYKECLDKEEKFLKTEAPKINFYKIDKDDIPEGITVNQLSNIFVLIKDDERTTNKK